MKDQETQQKFIELRVQGKTYAQIAQELNVCKRTLIHWSRKFQFEIHNRRAIEMEALCNQLLPAREIRVRELASQLRQVEDELEKRSISDLSTPRLFSLAASLRREILQETGPIQFISPLEEIPQDELHEQAQKWQG
jgi:transposase-like protein